MLFGVVQSVLLYGAAVWCDILQYAKYREKLKKAQRKVLLGVASAYRTVSMTTSVVDEKRCIFEAEARMATRRRSLTK